MENIDIEQIEKWTAIIWSLSWKGLIAFAIIYYRDTISYLIKTLLDIVGSWLKK